MALTLAGVTAPAASATDITAHSGHKPAAGTAVSCHSAQVRTAAGARPGTVCLRTMPGKQVPASTRSLAQLRGPHSAGSLDTTAAAQITPPAQCAVAPGGWTTPDPDRFTTCEGINYGISSSVTNSDGSTTQVGELDWTEYEWATTTGLSGDPTWQHGMILQVTNAWGTWSGGLVAELRSTCDSHTTACATLSSTVSDTQQVTLAANVSFANSWTEKDNGPADTTSGQTDTFIHTLSLVYTFQPNATAGYGGGTLVNTSDAAVPLTLRCDSNIANPATATGNLDGCVNQAFTPTYTIDRGTGGASADLVAWAQAHLSAHWGLQGVGQPLHRLVDPARQTANRNVICPNTLPRDPDVFLASCDEFPFAATYESAGMPGSGVTDGALCSQLTAVQTATGTNIATNWQINDLATPPGTYNASDKCARSMLPNSLNSTVGGGLGNFYTNGRLADNDPFWVAVTPATGAVALPVPTDLVVGALNPTEAYLAWTDHTGRTAQYQIRLQGGGTQTAPTGHVNYVWTGLTPGTQSCFRIRATTATEWSAYTPSLAPNYYTCVTTPVLSAVPPAAPSGVAAATPNSYTTHLSWTDNTGGAARYEISDGTESVYTAAGATSLDWGGQSPGSTTCFQVRAFTAAGASAWAPASPGLCVTTPAATCQSTLNTPDSSGYLDFYHGTGLAYAQDIQANGIDLTKSDPDTDFGKGFYVTTSLSQAQQWARKNFGSQTPSIVHFRIRVSSLTTGALCGLVFSTTNPSTDFFSFTKWIGLHTPPIGGAGYDFVEGPLLLNRSAFLNGQSPITGGQQDSFHTTAGVTILDSGFTDILAVPTGQYPLTIRSTANADYVSAELGYTGNNYAMLRARAATQGPWEQWNAVTLSNGDIALQSPANGDYVSAELGYTGNDYAMLRARAASVGPWETYQLVPNADGTYSLQSMANGDYVSAELGYTGDSYAELRARAGTIGPWEEFTDDAESYSSCTTCE